MKLNLNKGFFLQNQKQERSRMLVVQRNGISLIFDHQVLQSIWSTWFTVCISSRRRVGTSLPFCSHWWLTWYYRFLLWLSYCFCYCIDLLLKIKAEIKKTNTTASTFGEIAKICMGKPGEILVQASLHFTQLGFSTAYVIFIGENLNTLFPCSFFISLDVHRGTYVCWDLFNSKLQMVGSIQVIRFWVFLSIWLTIFILIGYIAIMFQIEGWGDGILLSQ